MTNTTQDSIVPDGWELLPGGRAALWIEGKAYRLKAPKLGELKEISALIRDVSEANAEMVKKIGERQAEVMADKDTPEDERKDALRSLNREMNDGLESSWWEALCHVASTLGADMPSGEDLDEMPAWLTKDANVQLLTLVQHFQTSPPPRGGRGK